VLRGGERRLTVLTGSEGSAIVLKWDVCSGAQTSARVGRPAADQWTPRQQKGSPMYLLLC
jgi:hypothetical protein